MIYLVVTIDVEPDCSLSWHYSNPLAFKGVSLGIKERLQPLFNKYEIIPTYLINNVVLEDNESVEVMSGLSGIYELGTHLHPEFIEPQKSVLNYAGAKGEANCCFYSSDIEYSKIENITNLFEKQFNYKPTSFRAGRFSAGNNTIKSLLKLGYKVDTSVTPHITWNDLTREHPVSYVMSPEQPFWTGEDTFPMPSKDDKNILEVPVSIINEPTSYWREILKSRLGIKRQIESNKPLWLRPKLSQLHEFKKIFSYFEQTYTDQQIIVLNMMFHNVEILPSLSPYNKTQANCNEYLESLRSFFSFCNRNKIISTNLSSLHEKYTR
jgi:hypothetical protein